MPLPSARYTTGLPQHSWTVGNGSVRIRAMCQTILPPMLVITVSVYYAAMKLFPSKCCVKYASGCDDKVL